MLQTDRGVGAVLSQHDDSGIEHPIVYYSRKLLPREANYSTFGHKTEHPDLLCLPAGKTIHNRDRSSLTRMAGQNERETEQMESILTTIPI